MIKGLSLFQLNQQKLDATKEAADALRIDAATINNGLTVKSNVPENAKFTDTVYTHPATHQASIIIQDKDNRFVTDTEKVSWNSKAENSLVTITAHGLMSKEDKVKLNGIEPQANNYTHPVSHPATMIIEDTTHRFMTDTERNKLKNIADGANKYIHPSAHEATFITEDTTHRFVTDAQINQWNQASPSDHVHTKAEIGLGNIDNTSDINKPISNTTQTALNTKLDKTGGTITGKLTIIGIAAQDALLTRGIQGFDGEGAKGDLYLNYNNNNNVYVNGANKVLDSRDVASLTKAGIVQLTSSLTDASEAKAATAKAVKTLQDTKANSSGSASVDFNIKSLNVSGPILPTETSKIDIGSPTNRFRAIYVDDAHLSTNTLYLGDTPVMGTSQDTVIIKADPDQSIMMKTIASGTTKIISESGTELSTSGMNADVVLKASGAGAKVNVSADQQVNFTSVDINFNGESTFKNDATIKKNLTVEGDLVVKGKNHVIEAETVQIKDNIIEINKGEIGSGVSAGSAGLKINRGDAPAYLIVFDETDDMFKVGMETSLEIIASRNWVNSVMYTHPSTHPATIITQDATHRFITDAERTKWNSKSDAHTHPYRPDTWVPAWTNVTGKPTFATVATSGSYNDLLNKPTIHTINDSTSTSLTNTWSTKKISDELSKKANTSHGNHIPTIETANNAKFLRNDNTWQVVTPENIGASKSDHIHGNATTLIHGFMSKEDKVKLDGIASNANEYIHPDSHPATMITEDASHRFMTDIERTKLDGIATNANNYVHPVTHAATIITQDATHRLVTDTEKITWNAKANTTIVTTTANGLMSKEDKIKLDAVSASAKKVEKSTTNGNILIDGVQTVVYTHPSGSNPHGTTKGDVGLGSVTNESKTTMFTNPSFTGIVSVDSTSKLLTEVGILGGGGSDTVLRQTEGSSWSELRVTDGSAENLGIMVRSSTNGGTAWTEVARITSGALTYKSNKIYHTGDKPTLNELGALSNSTSSDQIVSGGEYRVQSSTSTARFNIEFNEDEESLDFVYYL